MASGYVRVATVGDVAIRVHWAAPLVWVVGGISIGEGALGFGGVLASMVVYGVHALGHWALARIHRLQVQRIEVDGLGASIQYSGRATRAVHARVAFGGVIAHALAGLVLVLMSTASPWVSQMLWVNLVLGALNLLPFGSLDGAKGWRNAAAALNQPVRLPPGSEDHPALRAQMLVADVDRELGHPHRVAAVKPGDDLPELDFSGSDPVLGEITSQFNELMSKAREDAEARRTSASDEESS